MYNHFLVSEEGNQIQQLVPVSFKIIRLEKRMKDDREPGFFNIFFFGGRKVIYKQFPIFKPYLYKVKMILFAKNNFVLIAVIP